MAIDDNMHVYFILKETEKAPNILQNKVTLQNTSYLLHVSLFSFWKSAPSGLRSFVE